MLKVHQYIKTLSMKKMERNYIFPLNSLREHCEIFY